MAGGGTTVRAAVLAQGPGPKAPPAPDWGGPFLLPGLYLAGALLLGALAIAVVARWRRQPRADRMSPSDQLAQFRSLYDKGALSREEFDRLRGLLGEQLRQSLAVPPPAAPAKSQAVTGGPPATPAGPSGNGDAPPQPPPDGIRPA